MAAQGTLPQLLFICLFICCNKGAPVTISAICMLAVFALIVFISSGPLSYYSFHHKRNNHPSLEVSALLDSRFVGSCWPMPASQGPVVGSVLRPEEAPVANLSRPAREALVAGNAAALLTELQAGPLRDLPIARQGSRIWLDFAFQ